jgi:hypothetical protein
MRIHRFVGPAVAGLLLLAGAGAAHAQSWRGFYVGG